ncbi:unnamed protein product [marine sediment metagenome]|uniref:Uncharacterized protein n=1 Tax=marine sediment metagenome TaxID=412755 RepID=X0WRD5_9ZZZZ
MVMKDAYFTYDPGFYDRCNKYLEEQRIIENYEKRNIIEYEDPIEEFFILCFWGILFLVSGSLSIVMLLTTFGII